MRHRHGDPSAYARYLTDVRALLRRQRARGQPPAGAEHVPMELVEGNLFYVVKVAREYASFGVPFEDLLSEGNVGLLEAASRFDPTRGTLFVTYASWWIRKRILNLIARQMTVIRLPKYKMERLRRLRAAESELAARLGRQPLHEELSEATGLGIEEIMSLRVISQREVSLDHVLNEESGRKVEDSVSEQAENGFIDDDYETFIRSVIDTLPERERFVVRHRFGFEGSKCWTLQSIAVKLGLSRERVRQLEMKALDRIRKALRSGSVPGSPAAVHAESASDSDGDTEGD